MKKITCLLALAVFAISCGKKEEIKEEVKETESFAVFGDSISNEGALSSAEMMSKFESLKEGDTLNVKFS